MIVIAPNALVVLVGPSGSGKSTFARRHFAATQIIASDCCRAMVSDDEADQSASAEAFSLLRLIVRLRLRLGRLSVVDSTAVRRQDRRALLALGRFYRVPVVAILFDVDAETCMQRNLQRSRRVPEAVIEQQCARFRRSLTTIFAEGFDEVVILDAQAVFDITDVTIARQPMRTRNHRCE